MKEIKDMNILIIDDDIAFVEKLKKDLHNYYIHHYDEVHFFIFTSSLNISDIPQGISYAFIDINLPNKNGIDLGLEIKNIFPSIYLVFISSHSYLVHHSLIANPYFFIRKNAYEKDLKIFFELIKNSMKRKEIIELNYKRERKRIFTNNIIYIEAQLHKLIIYTTEGEYYDNRSLKSIMQSLPLDLFTRIHKSFVLNVSYISIYKGNQIILTNKKILTIGRSYRKKFEQFYMNYLIR